MASPQPNSFKLLFSILLLLGISCKKKAELKLCSDTNMAEVKGCKLYQVTTNECDSVTGANLYSYTGGFVIESNFYTQTPTQSLPKPDVLNNINYDACKNHILSWDQQWLDTWGRYGINARREFDYLNHKLYRLRYYDLGTSLDKLALRSTEEISYFSNFCVVLKKNGSGVLLRTDTAFFNTFGDIIKRVWKSETQLGTEYYLIDTNTLNPYGMVPNYESTMPRSKHITLSTYWEYNGKLVLEDSLYEYTKTTSGYLKSEIRYSNYGSGSRKVQNVYEYKDCY
ncbi:MAG: hypothetical protein CFE21_15515 [Bacteroidetes bacterium B1(2017)]|nr:MAG: hypothetical protein CFE21_15515 [Bacteroidetes bacterium B1(2017)]